jgi:hypothetical protein
MDRKAGKWNSRDEPKLSAQVKLWPTPTVCGNYNRKGASATSGDGLATAVKKWPTLTACMSKGSSPASLKRKSGRDRSLDRLDHSVMLSDGGHLNPTWVELLMGWPKGWTSLKPLHGASKDISGPLSGWANAEPWGPGWEDGIMRAAHGVPARVDRLRALGNGQVPQCAALAWRILMQQGTLLPPEESNPPAQEGLL